MTKFLVVSSGKGGVGKTTVCINLASALHKFGRKVLVVDAHLSKPNIGIHLGAHKVPISLQDVLKTNEDIKNAAYEHYSGLKLIASNVDNPEEAKLERLSDSLLSLHGVSEIVILDCASGHESDFLKTISASDEMIVVTTPDMISVTDTLKTIKKASEKGIKTIGAVVNRAGHFFDMERENIEALLEVPVLAIIPEDYSVKKSLYLKNPVVFTHPYSPASISYKKFAAHMIGEKYKVFLKQEKKKRLRNVLDKLKRFKRKSLKKI